MTDTRTKLSLKSFRQKNLTAKVLMAVSAGMAVCAPSIQAADDQWWFDVEVIVFERHIEPANILEQFKQSKLAPHSGELVDLLTPYIKPDLSYLRAGLPYCRSSKRLKAAEKHQQDFAFPINKNLDENLPSEGSAEPINSPIEPETTELVETQQSTADSFEDNVASGEVFSAQTDTQLDANPSVSEVTQQQLTEPTPAHLLAAAAPIEVEFIEWQMPSVFPCAYSEQIEPTLSLLSQTKHSEKSQQFLPDIDAVPVEIDGIQWQQKHGAFLLPKESFRMHELFSKLQKQRDIKPILHLNWRQEVVFGRENAKTFRLFAGKNFAGQFDDNGQAIFADTDQLITSLTTPESDQYIPQQELALQYGMEQQDIEQKLTQQALMAEQSSKQLFAKIDGALNDDSPISFALPMDKPDERSETIDRSTKLQDIWQLDGGIKVYLQNVGRVPYLHIDNHLDYRHAIYQSELTPTWTESLDTPVSETDVAITSIPQPNYLQSVTFNQLRRVISKQVHYFDHPLFGMIVRIHRYKWPEPGDVSEDITE